MYSEKKYRCNPIPESSRKVEIQEQKKDQETEVLLETFGEAHWLQPHSEDCLLEAGYFLAFPQLQAAIVPLLFRELATDLAFLRKVFV